MNKAVPSLRDSEDEMGSSPSTDVLGYFLASLRDC